MGGECVAIVHSMERIVVDNSGRIIFQRTEWEETEDQFTADLKCEHDEKHHEHTRIQDLIVERSFDRHRQVEALSLKRFMKGFVHNATLITTVNDADGSAKESISGPDAIAAWYDPLFNKSSSIAFAPSTPVYLRALDTFSVSSMFIVTHTGCHVSCQIVYYNSFNNKANLTRSEQILVGCTHESIVAGLNKDCGRVKPQNATVAADGSELGEHSEGDEDDDIDMDDEEEDEDDGDDHFSHDDL